MGEKKPHTVRLEHAVDEALSNYIREYLRKKKELDPFARVSDAEAINRILYQYLIKREIER